MIRWYAPNHPDCFAECDGDGWAVYTEQYGPCESCCDSEKLAKVLATRAVEGTFAVRVSGFVIAPAKAVANGFDDETLSKMRRGAKSSYDRDFFQFFVMFLNNYRTYMNEISDRKAVPRLLVNWYKKDMTETLWLLRLGLISALDT